MKAFVLQNGNLQRMNVAEPKVDKNDVKIALKSVGLNRRDLYIKGRVGNQPEALTLGSDGAGIIEEVGSEVTEVIVGDEVIINPSLRWYDKSAAPPENFDILGMPDNGTFAEKIVLHENQVEKKPPYLSWNEASVIALGALTGYRAMFTQGLLQAGQTVFIPGGSSGVATLMIQYAHAIGAHVIVSTRSKEKSEFLKTMQTIRVIDTDDNWQKVLANESIDLVIESVGAATFNRSLQTLKKGGRLVVFGATTDDEVTINLRDFFYSQYQMLGSTMGSRDELKSALHLMEAHAIRPVIGNTYSFDKIEQAFADLKQNKYIGKLAVSID